MNLAKILTSVYLRILSVTVLRKKISIIKHSWVFDEKSYVLSYPDVKISGIDPVLHYLLYGRFQGRDPGENFRLCFFIRCGDKPVKPGIRNVLPWIFRGQNEFHSKPLVDIIKKLEQVEKPMTIVNERIIDPSEIHARYAPPESQKGYENESFPTIPPNPLKLIAFFQPQYHLSEDNNKSGKIGVADWTITSKAFSRFPGHYQPKLPGELGYYDLRIDKVVHRQVELARQSGIYGFCLQHLYIEGPPPPGVPNNYIIKNKNLNIPFCFNLDHKSLLTCFDGTGKNVDNPVHQQRSFDKDKKFLINIEPVLNDERYIRIDGKPLLLLSHHGFSPGIKRTLARWRDFCPKIGLKGLFLVMIENDFCPLQDPCYYGFDAAVELPPFNIRNVSEKDFVHFYYPDFRGRIFNYSDVVNYSLNFFRNPGFTLFRGIMPAWDNTAISRDPCIYLHSSPEKYEKWLTELGIYTLQHHKQSQQFIFINAWNKWAEGAYLEPDRKYGYAYLNATARALCNMSNFSNIEKR